jgi:hypothetical protein
MHYYDQPCRRLIASGCLPDRAGQPTKIQLHLGLDELNRLHQASQPGSGPADGDQPSPGTGHTRTQPAQGQADALATRDTTGPADTGLFGPAALPGDASLAGHGTGPADAGTFGPAALPGDGSLSGHGTGPADAGSFGPAASPGDACDATIVPIVSGRVDQDLLDRLAAKLAGTDRDDLDRESISSLILANAVALLSGPGRPARCCACLTPGPWEPRSENRVPDLIRLTHPAILHHAESPGKCRWSTRCSTRTAPPTCGAGTGVPQPQPAHRSCLN